MPVENPLFLFPALSGGIFVIVGILMKKFPPVKINGLYGYRTRSSMTTKERWDFAQKCSSREMVRMGVILILFSISGFFFRPSYGTAVLIGAVLLLSTCVITMVTVERAIGRKFGDKK